ncbi:helicase-related protein [Candidatus Amarobacter glycogenicus]|uniref:helicase-related protein n=1 Tax=Candidatus Amarobacter glycogenicus TaxID=3140699 RepID=UPI0031370514|nr:hypothetical protein [Dehalococcoidia bacterium]
MAERLLGENMPCVVYHGGLSTMRKECGRFTDFRTTNRSCSDHRGVGRRRNLQFCRAMVNFDLPGTRCDIEQRVGRIHRVGQRDSPVHIFNLAAEAFHRKAPCLNPGS